MTNGESLAVSVDLHVSICCRHPLAVLLLEQMLGHSGIKFLLVCSLGESISTTGSEKCHVLIIDTCSVSEWPELAIRWRSQGGRTILLVPSREESASDHLRKLHLGIQGLVSLDSSLEHELPGAIRVVASGRLWFRRNALEEYVERTKFDLSPHSSIEDPGLTVREEQMVEFLKQGFSNKQIAFVLRISERTVKFHVSNVLRKLQKTSRTELMAG